MANICFTCGKIASVGRSRQHRRGVAGKRWKNRVTPVSRLFKPNLQPVTLMLEGKKLKVKLCTKCIKRRKKDASTAYLHA